MTTPTMVDVTEQRDSVAWAQLRASALVVLAITLLGAGLALALSLQRPPEYASTVTLVAQVTGTANDSETQVRTVQALVTSSTLADDLSVTTGAGSSRAIQNAISVARPPGSAVLNVTVTDSSRTVSRRIARAIAPALGSELNDLNNLPQVARHGANYAVEPFGQLTTRKVRAAAWRNAAVAAVLSFLVALSIAIFRAQRRPVVADSTSAAASFGSPVLATVPFLARATRPWNAVDAVGGMLSPGVAAAWPADLAHVLVVGSVGSAGADLVLMLGQTFASHGRRVLVVDADLADRRLSRRLKLRKAPGLGDAIAGGDVLANVQVVGEGNVPRGLYALSEESSKRLSVLPAGSIDDVTALAAPQVEEMLSRLSGGYDVVIVSGPSVPGRVPAVRLVEFCDVTLLVGIEGRTLLTDARATGQFVRALSTKPTGVVLLSRRSIDTLSVEISAPPRPAAPASAATLSTADPGRGGAHLDRPA